MPKRFSIFLSAIVSIIMFFSMGCSRESSNDNKIAYISANIDSEYVNTFKELQLGILFDFNLKLPNADKSWVNIWVEGYSNGKAVEPFPLTQLSYGLSPVQVVEEQMGFGIINPNSSEPQLFLYSGGARTDPEAKGNNVFAKSAITSWQYAIGNNPIGLVSGEEVVLAVYRQGKESLRAGYEYKDLDSINKMINNDITVLLLKIKVEERDKL